MSEREVSEMIQKKFIPQQAYKKSEELFIKYLNGDGDYPIKIDVCKFLLISNVFEKEMIYSFFEGLLDDVLCFNMGRFLLIIYHNKDHVKLKDIFVSFSDDFGKIVKVFEGFTIEVKNIKDLEYIIDLYEKYLVSDGDEYQTIADLIIRVSAKEDEALKTIKQVVLYKYLNDGQFEKLLQGLFMNNLNISKTAKAIYMHRNTINNKLYMLEKETGLEIQKFKDAVAMYELYK